MFGVVLSKRQFPPVMRTSSQSTVARKGGAASGAVSSVKVYNHLLGESTLAIFGTEGLAASYRSGFPKSIEGAPFLLPTDGSVTRRALEGWFDEIGVRPNIVGEFDDSAMLKAFAEGGLGLFAAPAVIQAEIKRQYRVHKLGLAVGVKERFYALTSERRIKHPAVVRVTETARERLFQTAKAAPRPNHST